MTIMTNAPAGWTRLPLSKGFAEVNGPVYGRVAPSGNLMMGFRVGPAHLNGLMVCHGGMLMSVADMLLCFTVTWADPERFVLTVSMGSDFLSSAHAGQWVEGEGRLLRMGRSLAFAECLMTADGEPCLRAHATLKLPREPNAPYNVRDLVK